MVVVYKQALLQLAFFALFLGFQYLPLLTQAGCPLDLTASNFTLVASMCSNNTDRAKCCRYMNAFVAVSVSRYANYTTDLGVPSDLTEVCVTTISRTMELYGIPTNATIFCGLGTKILVNYDCEGLTTVTQMLQSITFGDVSRNCKLPLPPGKLCRNCLDSGVTYLRSLVGPDNSIKLSTCRDATYAVLASRVDNSSALELASCFFNVPELTPSPDSSPSSLSPDASPSPVFADSPSSDNFVLSSTKSHHSYHLTVVPAIGIAVTGFALVMLVVLIVLIRRKKRELDDSNGMECNLKTSPSPRPRSIIHEGNSSAFRKFSYREIRKATEDFNMVIGRGRFGTVHKAEFSNGLVAAVKKMNKSSEQAEDEFCREIELLARLHHRHLVALKGFCNKKNERFLVYEYMANGSLKDHIHSTDKPPLSWETRMKIAIDVANALEYLHFYCDPPLCHRDIKSSNILLDENFVAKLADFGLAHASRDGSICFEPVNTDIRGTPGYVDPEYVVTQELTEKSDVYSYGVVLLEIITGKGAVDEGRNLVELSQPLLLSESRRIDLVDPRIKDCIDGEQLETVVAVVRWCTEKEGVARPSIKQVLRLLYESCDPLHLGLAMAVEENKGRSLRGDSGFQSGDIRGLASSSSTTSRSHCSRSFLLETGSPHSPPNGLSF
ncbi:PREDICTED: probable receptor-like protein kinase At1g49730 isoform X1 [Camelina sativa]|uniref:Probable receptor-like protein kinase At1g49730 isoform X1 n=2 Tax=Camelina sativa TaxID=90675 RepID=A0ABM0XLW4_CAMSA|nr:PREDICTED: probable receptor-like protein kinase At1g49730 isoform X1 [Camelina sativa]